jgi:hypothetical protein
MKSQGLKINILYLSQSRNSTKKFFAGKWPELISEDFSENPLINKYKDSSLVLVNKVLPHGVFLFVLFFLIISACQPFLWTEVGSSTIVAILFLYTLYKGGIFLTVQEEENMKW